MQLEVTNALKAQREHAREQLQNHLKCASACRDLLRGVGIPSCRTPGAFRPASAPGAMLSHLSMSH